MEPGALSPHFDGVKEQIRGLQRVCAENEIPLAALLLNYGVLQPDIDRVVIGVARPAELCQNVGASCYAQRVRELMPQLDLLAMADEEILLPYNWR